MQQLIMLGLCSLILVAGCTLPQETQECKPIIKEIVTPCEKETCPVAQECTQETRIIKETRIIDCREQQGDWYLGIAKKKIKGYYGDYEGERFSACQNKTTEALDHIMTAQGFYYSVDNKLKSEAYEDYINAVEIIAGYCNNQKDQEKAKTTYNYHKWFNRYLIHVNNTNITQEFKE